MSSGAPLELLDAGALYRWLGRSVAALEAARDGINRLNVFPVADADTGTNLLHTVQAALAELQRSAPATLSATAASAAAGALIGARGSSGVILARYLQGFAAGIGDRPAAAGSDLQRALSSAADAAYGAVADPIEGTILSVARAAAKASSDAHPADLVAVASAAASGARFELARTTTQLAALAAAHVVDAGGQGLVVVLEALGDVLSGVATPPAPVIAPAPSLPIRASEGFAYEVQYLLTAPDDALVTLRQRLSQLGDAVAIVSGAGVHNVHVHVDDVGPAIEAALDLGIPSNISVTRFADQISACGAPTVVALCPDDAVADLFRAAGAVTIAVAADGVATEARVDDAVRRAIGGSRAAILLPNARWLRETVDAVAADSRASGCQITVVPTRSVMQGLAALAVHDPTRRTDDDVVAMSAAAAATRFAEVTRAQSDGLTTVGPCRAGDVLGLIDDDVAVVGDEVTTVARSVLDRLLIGGGDMVTVVECSDAPGGLGSNLTDYLAATRPAVETVLYAAHAPGCAVLIGVE